MPKMPLIAAVPLTALIVGSRAELHREGQHIGPQLANSTCLKIMLLKPPKLRPLDPISEVLFACSWTKRGGVCVSLREEVHTERRRDRKQERLKEQ